MTTRKVPDPLDKYLPNEATVEAVMNGPTEFPSKADPKLVARLRELNRISSENLLPPAPPSEVVYTEVEIRPMSQGDRRAEPKIKIALPPAPSETPTQPSLKRFEGEPEVPGVVRAPPRPGLQRLSVRSAVLAVLAVIVPVLLVIFFMGRTTGGGERTGAASATSATSAPVVATTAPLATAPSAIPAATMAPSAVPAPTVAPAPSAVQSAVPAPTAPANATARPVAPLPAGTAAKRLPLRGQEEPHDAPPPAVAPSATPSAVPAVAPTVAPVAPAATASKIPTDVY